MWMGVQGGANPITGQAGRRVIWMLIRGPCWDLLLLLAWPFRAGFLPVPAGAPSVFCRCGNEQR